MASRGDVVLLSSSVTVSVLFATPFVALRFAHVTLAEAPHAVFEVMVMTCEPPLAGKSTTVGVSDIVSESSSEAKTSVSSLSEQEVREPRGKTRRLARARLYIDNCFFFIYLIILYNVRFDDYIINLRNSR